MDVFDRVLWIVWMLAVGIVFGTVSGFVVVWVLDCFESEIVAARTALRRHHTKTLLMQLRSSRLRKHESYARRHRAPFPTWPVLVLVFIVALIASTLTLALSALSSLETPSGGPTGVAPSQRGGVTGLADRVRIRSAIPRPFESDLGDGSAVRANVVARSGSVVSTPRDDRQAEPEITTNLLSHLLSPAATPARIEDVITAAAVEFDQDPARLVAVAQCESRLDPFAVGRAQELGLFQFMPRTFAANAPRLGYSIADIFDVRAQSRVAAEMFSRGQAWQWSCAGRTP